jgi:hypothetical protein
VSAEIAAHFAGDYLVQSDWMAAATVKRHLPAAAHALAYTGCFLPLTRDWRRLAVIGGTHFVIDRWRLAKYVCWAKNQAAPRAYRHAWGEHVQATGYHRPTLPGDRKPGWDDAGDCDLQEKPVWMAVWLMIWADNGLHMILNHLALREWS